MIERVFREGPDGFKGGFSAENYIAMTGTSRATTIRDQQDLVEMGALSRTGERRHTRYWLELLTSTKRGKHDSISHERACGKHHNHVGHVVSRPSVVFWYDRPSQTDAAFDSLNLALVPTIRPEVTQPRSPSEHKRIVSSKPTRRTAFVARVKYDDMEL